LVSSLHYERFMAERVTVFRPWSSDGIRYLTNTQRPNPRLSQTAGKKQWWVAEPYLYQDRFGSKAPPNQKRENSTAFS
jgi:hypothetical protein